LPAQLLVRGSQAEDCESTFIDVVEAALELMLQADERADDGKQTSCAMRIAFSRAVRHQFLDLLVMGPSPEKHEGTLSL
jgi:cation transport regulator ChaB